MRALVLSLLFAPAVAWAHPVLSRFSVGLETQAAVALTRTRTQGGIGGGALLTFAIDEHWVADARVAWLVGLGSHSLIRAGAGWQRTGLWSPLFRVSAVVGLGGSLDFGIDGRFGSRAPSFGLVLGAALLRFRVANFVISGLELEGGLSTDLLSVGPRVGLTLLSLSARWGDE